MPTAIGHSFISTLGRRKIAELDETHTKETMHPPEMSDLRLDFRQKINLQLSLKKEPVIFIGLRMIVRTKRNHHGQLIGQSHNRDMDSRPCFGGGKGFATEMDKVSHFGISRGKCEFSHYRVVSGVIGGDILQVYRNCLVGL